MTSATSVRAERLIKASRRRYLDPFTDIDWSIPWEGDGRYHLPPSKLTLNGTPQWDALSEAERVEYSRHEFSALCATGIFLENLAMQTLLRHARSMSVVDPAHDYVLVEVAEECKHSIMFAEYIRWAGTPDYSPPAGTSDFKPADGPAGRVSGFILLLAVEELLDAGNRAMASDPGVHPVAAEVARLHVREEARHVSFARAYLEENVSELSEEDLGQLRELAALGVHFISSLLVNPAVFQHLGIADGADAAKSNPVHLARVRADLGPLTSFLTKIGLIDDGSAELWIQLGLLEP